MKIVKVLCAWCIAEGLSVTPLREIEVPDDAKGESHGICDYHAEQLLAESNELTYRRNKEKEKEVMPMR